jgi:uncharacterized protein YecT (DUF1311 family)
MRPTLSLLLLALVGISGRANAQECVGTPDDVAACNEAAVADEELNAAYRDLLAKLDNPSKVMSSHHAAARKSVIRAQRAWLTFREQDCAAVFDVADGSSKAALGISCEADHARLRAKQLREMANAL